MMMTASQSYQVGQYGQQQQQRRRRQPRYDVLVKDTNRLLVVLLYCFCCCLLLFVSSTVNSYTFPTHHPTRLVHQQHRSLFSRLHIFGSNKILHPRPDIRTFSYDDNSNNKRTINSFRSKINNRNEIRKPSTTRLQSTILPPGISTAITSNPIVFTIGMIVIHVGLGASGTPIVAKATKLGGWYRKIGLPTWTPPDRIFPIAWTFLYSTMGFAVSRILLKSTTSISNASNVLLLWIFHYILNLVWAPVFFGKQNLVLGLRINYMLLFTLAFGLIRPFYRIDHLSGIILIPYLAWLMFATILNETICGLNPTDSTGYNNAKVYAQLQQLQEKAYEYAFGSTRK